MGIDEKRIDPESIKKIGEKFEDFKCIICTDVVENPR